MKHVCVVLYAFDQVKVKYLWFDTSFDVKLKVNFINFAYFSEFIEPAMAPIEV